MSRAQQTTGFVAAMVFAIAVIAAAAMQSAGTTTAAARTASLVSDVGHTTAERSARFAIAVTTAGKPAVTVTGAEDFAHHAVDIHVGNVEERLINGVLYVHAPAASLPPGKSWVSLPAPGVGVRNALANNDPTSMLGAIKNVKSSHTVGHGKQDGANVTEYAVTLDLLASLQPGALSSTTVPLPGAALRLLDTFRAVPAHVWVDDSKRIRRFMIDLKFLTIDEQIDLRLSAFGAKVTVPVPPADQVVPRAQVPDALRGISGLSGLNSAQ